MDINQIRLTNANRIVVNECDDNKAKFSRKIGKLPQNTSKWWSDSDRKNIGTSSARSIEQAFSLPKGWLDVAHHDNSDLEQDPYKRQLAKIKSGKTYEIPLLWTALLEQQQLKLTLLQQIKGKVMLLSTDQEVWSIQLVGTHPNFILNQGWGIIVEPQTPITVNEYALVKRTNGEILLRVIAYQDDDKLIITNPITSEQTTLPWSDIDKTEYCYIGIPPSKIIQDAEGSSNSLS